MMADAQPVIHGLQRKMDIFGGFQFDHHETPMQRDAEKIDYAAIGGGEGRHLGIEKSRIELGFELRWIALNQRFDPAFRSGAIERMIALVSEWIAVEIEFAEQCFDSCSVQGPGLRRASPTPIASCPSAKRVNSRPRKRNATSFAPGRTAAAIFSAARSFAARTLSIIVPAAASASSISRRGVSQLDIPVSAISMARTCPPSLGQLEVLDVRERGERLHPLARFSRRAFRQKQARPSIGRRVERSRDESSHSKPNVSAPLVVRRRSPAAPPKSLRRGGLRSSRRERKARRRTFEIRRAAEPFDPGIGEIFGSVGPKRARNVSTLTRLWLRGPSVRRTSRRDGRSRPKRRTSKTILRGECSRTRRMRRTRLRSSDQRRTSEFLPSHFSRAHIGKFG